MENSEILTIFALFLGPVFAVLVTRYIDYKRDIKTRKLEVFRTLMRYRKERLTYDFVGALNIIEVEFNDDKNVIEAWKKLFEHFCKLSTHPHEDVQRGHSELEKLSASLLQKIAKNLGIKIDSLEIINSGYTPEGWVKFQNETADIRFMLLELLEGKRSLPINVIELLKQDIKQDPKKIS